MTRHIVYDDDHLRAIWRPGRSDFLLVTFGDLFSIAKNDSFFADTPVDKLNLSCLGLMPKAANWFPGNSVRAAAEAAHDMIKPYASRVTYGGSMGGYGAIKYSALFNATQVLAFCPQWSIDPEECVGRRSGYERFFQPYMAGMGILPSEVSGRVYVFHDPGYARDSYHFRQIARVAETVAVPVYASDHAVTTILAGTDALQAMIDTCRSDDRAGCLRVVNRSRRKSPYRTQILLRRAMIRQPRRVLAILDALRARCIALPGGYDALYADLAAQLIRNGDDGHAARAVAAISVENRVRATLLDRAVKSLPQSGLLERHGMILTAHRTLLGYDALTGKLAHIAPHLLPTVRGAAFSPAVCVDGRLAIVVGDELRACAPYKTVIRLTEFGSGSHPLIHAVEQPEGAFALRFQNGYLSATRKGVISYDLPHIKRWETFTRV